MCRGGVDGGRFARGQLHLGRFLVRVMTILDANHPRFWEARRRRGHLAVKPPPGARGVWDSVAHLGLATMLMGDVRATAGEAGGG